MSIYALLLLLFTTVQIALGRVNQFLPADPILRFVLETEPSFYWAESQPMEDKRQNSARELNDMLRKTWLGRR